MKYTLKNTQTQKYVFIISDITLIIGIILLSTRMDLSVPFFGLFLFQFFTILLAIPLVFGIAAHAMHYFSQKEPRSLSLFITSKLFLLTSIGGYIFIARPFIFDNAISMVSPTIRIAIGAYLIAAVCALILPFSKSATLKTPNSHLENPTK